VAQKSKPLPNYIKNPIKSLELAIEIRFLNQIKISIKRYNITRWY